MLVGSNIVHVTESSAASVTDIFANTAKKPFLVAADCFFTWRTYCSGYTSGLFSIGFVMLDIGQGWFLWRWAWISLYVTTNYKELERSNTIRIILYPRSQMFEFIFLSCCWILNLKSCIKIEPFPCEDEIPFDLFCILSIDDFGCNINAGPQEAN